MRLRQFPLGVHHPMGRLDNVLEFPLWKKL
nr:MAG TPA: hypothetical protein [Caudoviricetes sp.]